MRLDQAFESSAFASCSRQIAPLSLHLGHAADVESRCERGIFVGAPPRGFDTRGIDFSDSWSRMRVPSALLHRFPHDLHDTPSRQHDDDRDGGERDHPRRWNATDPSMRHGPALRWSPRAAIREASVVGFMPSNSAAPFRPKILPPLRCRAAPMLSRSCRFS